MNGLPETFSIREAFDILGWQGSRKGLARHLQSEGFVSSPAREPYSKTVRMIWQRPALSQVATAPSCACRCHTGSCGANEMDLAERAIRMIQHLGPQDAKMIEEIQYLVNRAGVDYAQAALKPGALHDDVPF